MINENLASDDLSLLRNATGEICVSIIVPAHRLSPERRVDKLRLERAIDQAKQLLHYTYPEERIKSLLSSIDELFRDIDFSHNEDGIGLYISSDVKLSVQFPFEVDEKVIVRNNFETRDLLYKEQYSTPYFVLLLAEQGGRLFQGRLAELTEIADDVFPMQYEDDFEYSKPSPSSSLAGYSHVKDFRKDKSELQTMRLRDFFRTIDRHLGAYLGQDLPLIPIGVEKELALFSSVSDHNEHVIDTVAGNHNRDNVKQLSDLTWPIVRTNLLNECQTLIKGFEDSIGRGLGITGIQNVWAAAKEGKGLKLLVEKDYRIPGFLADNDYRLYIRPPKQRHKILPDAAEEIVETVLNKDGKVFFVDNGALSNYQKIALITRYE